MRLDDFKDTQEIAYNIIMNEISNNHISHAYLIDENNCVNALNFVMSFVKDILCLNKDVNEREVICKRVDDGNYPEIKIIEPDGLFIKKQQILDLQKEFSMAAIEGNMRIYIIKDAEKMRSETANSMLKFLEEPDNDIVAILMTNNYNNLLSTIISRCQIIRLANESFSNDTDEVFLIAINFIKNIENSGIITISREQELLFSNISTKERDRISDMIDNMISIYYDIINVKIGNLNIKYGNYIDDFKDIADLNSINSLLDKVNILIKYKDAVKNGVNVNFFFDSLIVSIGG